MSGEDLNKCKIENSGEAIAKYYKDTYSTRAMMKNRNLLPSISPKTLANKLSVSAETLAAKLSRSVSPEPALIKPPTDNSGSDQPSSESNSSSISSES